MLVRVMLCVLTGGWSRVVQVLGHHGRPGPFAMTSSFHLETAALPVVWAGTARGTASAGVARPVTSALERPTPLLGRVRARRCEVVRAVVQRV